ncbi:DUF2726 domain-containing protein [Leptolyngbya sp. CCNP1308]|uniref:DUF2726 domain-containing protein n=1 Tax=Leptolyngbya sp. CCNP1308 TaxID=3110255 RepID=UPI002B1EE08B|nr:DUF2726 domain-containing protein [Leptolyngbya sp. CCNP1308]MEA5451498.1 DUF2726 domain-containing protein [Leptolyngbya sp. CCNP1308]
MSSLIFLLLICTVVGVGGLVLLGSQGNLKPPQSTQGSENNAGQSYTYSCQKYLFTRTELTFYRALQAATQGQYLVFGKVRVADVLKPQTDNRGDWQRAFNKISAKHFDFVLCDPASLKILAAVELDGSSHQRGNRIKRDDFLNQAVASAGLPLIRFLVQESYRQEAIQRDIAKTLGAVKLKSTPKPMRKTRPQSN